MSARRVLITSDPHRRLLGLNLAVQEDKFDDFSIVGRSEDGFEFLLRWSTENALRTLSRVEAIEGIYEFDESDSPTQ